MREVEAEVKTRVRKGGKNEDRVAGNLVWGEFIHQTARPINGVPDPHLHAHCFAFNVTFDEEENRWKAAQFGDVKRDASFFEAMFHSRISERLAKLGLAIERTRKGWEIAGLSKRRSTNFRGVLRISRKRPEPVASPARWKSPNWARKHASENRRTSRWKNCAASGCRGWG